MPIVWSNLGTCMPADAATETLRHRCVWSLGGICCGRDRFAQILRRGFRRPSSRSGRIYLTGTNDRGSSASDRFRVESRGSIAVPQRPESAQGGRAGSNEAKVALPPTTAGEIQHQAAMIGYIRAFHLLALTTAVAISLALLLRSTPRLR